jgi:hypothetical protein
VFVRAVNEPPLVCMHAPVLTDAIDSPRLMARLNALNEPPGCIRFALVGRTVVAYAETPAQPYVAEHVSQLLERFCMGCNGLVPRLRTEFGDDLFGGAEPFPRVLH